MKWNLSEAKNKLTEVFNKALEEGPQEITQHRGQTVFVISKEDFEILNSNKHSFKEFLMSSNIGELDLSRNKSSMREIEL